MTHERDEIIAWLAKQGFSYSYIGDRFGLSRQRAHQIANAPTKERPAQTTHKCRLCGHVWEGRVTLPRACPNCKRYDWGAS